MDLLETKIVVIFLLILITMVSGLLPIVLSKFIKLKGSKYLDRAMGCILCIGGGVLLSTVFVHMVPEVREELDRAVKLGYLPNVHYPFAELTIVLGFFLIYAVETVTHKIFGKGGHGGGHGHGIPSGTEVHELRNGKENGCCVHKNGADNAAYHAMEESSGANG